MDIRDIELIIQWLYTDSLCTLSQRLGRGGRDPDTEATGIYLVEPDYFDANKLAKAKRKKKREEKKRPKEQPHSSVKRRRIHGSQDVSHVREVDEEGSDSDDYESDGDDDEHIIQPPVLVFASNSGDDSSALPHPKGLSIEEYEKIVMDTYINAGSRRLCRRRIQNEYFQNHLARKLH